MKITILSALLLVSILSFGQTAKEMIEAHKCVLPIDTTTGLITIEFTGKQDSVRAQELYSRFKIWAAKSFKSAQNVIQFDDPGVGQVVIKGNFETHGMIRVPMNGPTYNKYYCEFMIDARFKEGRYKVKVSDIIMKIEDGTAFQNAVWAFHRWNVDGKISESGMSKRFYELGFDLEKNWNIEMDNLIASLKLGLTQKSASEEDW